MAIRVDIISNESCDHCGIRNDRPLVRLRHRCPVNGKQEVWVHAVCWNKIFELARKALAKFEAQS